jgi:hypothetical protein
MSLARGVAATVRHAACVGALGGTLGVMAADAQIRSPPQRPIGPTPRAGSWEIGGGPAFVGGYDLGSASADLSRNSTTDTNPFTLFVTDSNVTPAWSPFGRVAYYVSPKLAVEGGVRFGRPVYQIDLSGDAESAPDVVAEETLDQYLFDASVVWHFSRPPASRSRIVPFVYGGAGYLRELHEAQELVETGIEYHAGAGIKYWFGNAPRRFGFRGDGGLSVRDGGFDFDEGLRIVPVAGVSLVFLF